eukprot:TRINITY_DN8290_c0_g1_i1.p1 TRINITY_DN8290_c0_g1~~TRINITY_DN8290_c0_g1_i1.p1  ORF type:complete len:510 (+),score=91.90 TRINITY_DN8290_c0_g1_i1:141-1532(+)
MSGVCIPIILFPYRGNYHKLSVSYWISLVQSISKETPIFLVFLSQNLSEKGADLDFATHEFSHDTKISELVLNMSSVDDMKNLLDRLENLLFEGSNFNRPGTDKPELFKSEEKPIEMDFREAIMMDMPRERKGKSVEIDMPIRNNLFNALKLGESIPMSWINLTNRITKIRKAVISWEEWRKVGQTCGIISHDELIKATRYMHHTTKLRFFSGSDALSEYLVVLDIKWLAKVLTSLLTPNPRVQIRNDGMCSAQDIEKLWVQDSSDKYQSSKIIDLLVQLNILWKDDATNLLFIPLLSNPVLPCEIHSEWDNQAKSFTIWRNYLSNFIPEGSFSYLLIKLLKDGWDRIASWKNGAILTKSNVLLRIEESGYINCCLSIIMRGTDGETLKEPLSRVIMCVGHRYSEMKVPCYRCMESSIFPPSDFRYDKILDRMDRQGEVTCERCHHKINTDFCFPEFNRKRVL